MSIPKILSVSVTQVTWSWLVAVTARLPVSDSFPRPTSILRRRARRHALGLPQCWTRNAVYTLPQGPRQVVPALRGGVSTTA